MSDLQLPIMKTKQKREKMKFLATNRESDETRITKLNNARVNVKFKRHQQKELTRLGERQY